MAKIEEKIEVEIETKFRNEDLEKEIIAYIVRKSAIKSILLDSSFLTIKPLRDILFIIKKNKITFSKVSLLQKIKMTNLKEKLSYDIYQEYVEELFDIDISHIDTKNIIDMMNQLAELSESRRCLIGIKNIVKNLKDFRIDKVKEEFRDLGKIIKVENNEITGNYLDDYKTRKRLVIEKASSDEDRKVGIATGLREFDRYISGLMAGEFGVIAGKPGCISGDTIIKLSRRNGNRFTHQQNLNIAKAYNKFNNSWSVDRYIQVHSKDGLLKYRKVKNIWYQGEKYVYEVTTKSGKKLKATKDHPFEVQKELIGNRGILEKDNFIALKNLKIGDFIFTKGVNKKNKIKKDKTKRRVIYCIPYHPFAAKMISYGFNYKRSFYSRLLYEAYINNLNINDFLNIVKNDPIKAKELKYLDSNQIVHHINENKEDDRIENYEILNNREHGKKHGNSIYFNNISLILDEVVAIKKIGIESVYDLEVEGDEKGFLANDIIVHNCGKSAFMICFAIYAYLHGFNVVYATGEMPQIDIQYRMDANLVGINLKKFRVGSLEKKEYGLWSRKIEVLKASLDSYLDVISFPRNFNTELLEAEMNKIQEKHKQEINLLCIDYINIMNPVNGATSSNKEWQGQADVIWDIKALTAEFNGGISCWTAGQIKDEFFEADKLTLDAIKYSRAISETAPIVCGLVQTQNDFLENEIQFQVLKMRNTSTPKESIILKPDLNKMKIDTLIRKRTLDAFDDDIERRERREASNGKKREKKNRGR